MLEIDPAYIITAEVISPTRLSKVTGVERLRSVHFKAE
jgi:hypothetical protein